MSLSRGILLNVGIGLLAFASLVGVYVTRDVTSPGAADGHERSLFAQFQSEDATRLELVGAGQKLAIERTRSDGGSATFQLVDPVKELADAATVDKLLSALASARVLRPVEPGPPLSTFALDKPSLRLVVQTTKHSYHLALGGNAPAPEGARYVQVSSDGNAPSVLVVSKSVADDLAVELDAFRLRSLVAVSESEVTRISIASAKLSLTLRRSTGTNFVIDGEPKVLADRETMKSLFFQLSRLSASTFLTLADAEAALGSERAHFEIETKDSPQVIGFDAGGSCPGDPTQLVVIRRTPAVQSACAPRELEATLRLPKPDFWDKHPFSLHTDEVEELDQTSAKGKSSLVRKGTGFVLHESTETQVELEAGNQRIAELLEAQGERVEHAQLNELGLEPPLSSVTLRSSAARDVSVVTQVVRVGKKDDSGNLWLYREQDGVVLRVPPVHARAFSVESTLLYSRKLSEFGPSSFISAEIERDQDRQLLRRGSNQELQLDAPKGFTPDGVLSSDLIQALGALSAERFVADRDDGSFGFKRAPFSVRFAFKNSEGATVERQLRFGDETALGVFGTLGEAGPVFVLSRAVRDTCDTLLINRAIFPTNAEALRGLTLETHGRTLHLERQGERFSAVPRDAFPDDKVADLLEALNDLRPEAGLHAGPARPAEGFSKPTLTIQLAERRSPPQTLTFGAGDSWRSTSVFYLRVSGVDATFVIAQSKVRALSDAL